MCVCGERDRQSGNGSVMCVQVMQELKRLLAYYKRETGETPELLGVALSARKNLCIHPEVGVAVGVV